MQPKPNIAVIKNKKSLMNLSIACLILGVVSYFYMVFFIYIYSPLGIDMGRFLYSLEDKLDYFFNNLFAILILLISLSSLVIGIVSLARKPKVLNIIFDALGIIIGSIVLLGVISCRFGVLQSLFGG